MTNDPFQPKIVRNDSSQILLDIDFKTAQAYCNFVLFEPTYLPAGSNIIKKSLQTETDKTRASHYCVIEGRDGLELSIKQFNFSGDIETIPAYDHPNLWKCESVLENREIFSEKLRIDPFIFEGENPAISDNIIWIGFNYKAEPQKALSMQIMRTSIEITIKNAYLDNEDLLKISRGMKLADEQVANRINRTSFVELSRKYRYAENDGNVPISYWKYQRSSQYKIKMYPLKQIPSTLFGRKSCPLAIDDYYLNSATQFLDPQTNETKEVEYLFEHHILIGSYIRMLMSPIGTGSITIPPEIDNQHCQHREFDCHNTRVYHTYLKEEYGMHGAAWKNQTSHIMIFVKPASWTNINWFEELITRIMIMFN